MATANETLFTPTKLTAGQKAESTHSAAMQIINAEVAAREKKTERLRQLRLEQEANAPVTAEPSRARKRKA